MTERQTVSEKGLGFSFRILANSTPTVLPAVKGYKKNPVTSSFHFTGQEAPAQVFPQPLWFSALTVPIADKTLG